MTIDLSNIQSDEELHLLFKDKLQFPAFYGRNWDAFWDAITGLVELPEVLTIVGYHLLKEVLPTDAAILEDIINKYNTMKFSKIIIL